MKTRIATAVSLCLTVSVHAATERDLDSHVHGGAALNLVVDNNQVFVEFLSPWANLVGFEHAPSTDEQHAAVDEALSTLKTAEALFTFSGSSCALSEVSLENGMGESDDHDEGPEHVESAEHDEHDEGAEHDEGPEHVESAEHDDHDEGAEHDDHDEGAEHDEHDDHEESAHSSISASYLFACENASDLGSVTVHLFDQWSGIEEVDVQLVGPGAQTALELTGNNATIDLEPVL